MRPAPSQKLDPKVKNVWRISAVIWTVIIYAVCTVPFAIMGAVGDDMDWASLVALIETAVFVVAFIVFAFVVPPLRYIRWSYQLDPEFLDIEKGIIWRERTIIPFIRVQNTDTQQGPLMRAFHVSAVTISTAAGEHQIPGVDESQAAALRDKAAEFARIAREDV